MSTISAAETSVLAALSYFNVFNHPLTLKELSNLSSLPENQVREQLQPYLAAHKCFESKGYFGLNQQINAAVSLRLEKEQRAQSYFNKLPFYTRLIKSFPFVKGIAVSGSLSKGVMHEEGDIDYFIITKKNRLWICRTLLILFKKIILLNSRKYFCVNHFVDENNLEIIDKNIFTAVEIIYLLPVYGEQVFDTFRLKNNWTETYFKTFTSNLPVTMYNRSSFVKKIYEFLISGWFADKLDLFFMQLTYKRWKSKFNTFDAEKLERTMRSQRGISKHHPLDFQKIVLEKFEAQMKALNL